MRWLVTWSRWRTVVAVVVLTLAFARFAMQVFAPASGTFVMYRVFFVQGANGIEVVTPHAEHASNPSLSRDEAFTQLEQRSSASLMLMARRPHRASGVFIGWRRAYFNPLRNLEIGSTSPLMMRTARWESAYAADRSRYDELSDALLSALDAELSKPSATRNRSLAFFASESGYTEALRRREGSIVQIDGLARFADYTCIALMGWSLLYLLINVRSWTRGAARRARVKRGECPGCGYSREGLEPSAPCPECGG